MNNQLKIEIMDIELLSPTKLLPEEKKICEGLDALYNERSDKKIPVKPSEMLQGALYAIREECRSNPDQISQTAHSLREILYLFENIKGKNELKNQNSDLKPIKNNLLNLAHHNTNPSSQNMEFSIETLKRTLEEFKTFLIKQLPQQLDYHQKIDKVLSSGPNQIIA